MRSLLVLLVACKSGSSLPSNAPPPAACAVDTDCTIALVGPDTANPCCDVTMTAAPLAKAYLTFMADWRKQHCEAKPSCKPLALPGHPAACAHEARCVAGRCENRC